jgi:hypothetical protein
MIAKIVVWAPDRGSAIRLARRVLAATTVLGLGTNQEFLGKCLAHPGFLDKNYTTGFIELYKDALFEKNAEKQTEGDMVLAVQTSMVFKYCAERERLRARDTAFRSISSKFRVQSMDKSNVKTDHITVGGKGYMISYLPRRYETSDTVQVWEIQEPIKLDDKTQGKFLNKSGGVLVHRYYSAMIPPLSSSAGNPRTMEISIVHADLRRRNKGVLEEWIEGDITFQIDRSVKTCYVATEGDWRSHDDSSQVLWIHSPELCKGVKSIRRTPLTFAGKLDERTSGSAAELGNFFCGWELICRSRWVVFGADAVSDITGYEEGWGESQEGRGITCHGEYEDGSQVDSEK